LSISLFASCLGFIKRSYGFGRRFLRAARTGQVAEQRGVSHSVEQLFVKSLAKLSVMLKYDFN
jgi:hypothetical protein